MHHVCICIHTYVICAYTRTYIHHVCTYTHTCITDPTSGGMIQHNFHTRVLCVCMHAYVIQTVCMYVCICNTNSPSTDHTYSRIILHNFHTRVVCVCMYVCICYVCICNTYSMYVCMYAYVRQIPQEQIKTYCTIILLYCRMIQHNFHT